ncbi:hypothetical protein FJTKL_07077 [Diaporthe vaccinii]|uniref:Integral membrane protein n=1 Tax=Diaporthe vaccinii TaxID=105482 RepID=A0ABR4EV24_9PEZI
MYRIERVTRDVSIARNPEPFVTVSLNDILETDELNPSQPHSLRRESAPSKAPDPPSRRKQYSPGIVSVVGRDHSTRDSSEETSGITRTGSASPRRSSLSSPDQALADDEDQTGGPQRNVSRDSPTAAGRGAGTG